MAEVNKSVIFVDDSRVRVSDQNFTFPPSPNTHTHTLREWRWYT